MSTGRRYGCASTQRDAQWLTEEESILVIEHAERMERLEASAIHAL